MLLKLAYGLCFLYFKLINYLLLLNESTMWYFFLNNFISWFAASKIFESLLLFFFLVVAFVLGQLFKAFLLLFDF